MAHYSKDGLTTFFFVYFHITGMKYHSNNQNHDMQGTKWCKPFQFEKNVDR